MTGPEVAALLGLEPLPHEGGMWAQTWIDDLSTAIYFLLQPGDFSAMHRLDGPEIWHHYAGDPVRLVLLHDDGRPALWFVHRRLRQARPEGGPSACAISDGVRQWINRRVRTSV